MTNSKSYSTEIFLPQTVCYIKTLWNRHCDLNNVLRARTQKLANEIVIFVRKHSYVRALYFAEKHNGDILRSICSISIVALFQRLRPHWGSDDIWHHKIVYLLFRTIWNLARAFSRKKFLFCLLTICTVEGLCAIQQASNKAATLRMLTCKMKYPRWRIKIVPRTELSWTIQT